jgi:two-component sensor histidine kinase
MGSSVSLSTAAAPGQRAMLDVDPRAREAELRGERDAARAECAALRAELALADARDRTAVRDANHRLKNTLHLVCSLLSLQRNKLKGAQAQREFDAAVERVAMLGRIYGRYQQVGATIISARTFIKELCEELIGAQSTPEHVALAIDAPDMPLSLDRAIPIGLILHELISNSLRHAFPGGRGGRVEVALARRAPRGWSLSVADDGTGLASARVGRGFGLQLVRIMTAQLRGTLERADEPGTRHIVRFEDDAA